MGGWDRISRFFRRYTVVILFPSATVSCIYADLRHTRLWKKKLAELKEQELS